MRVAIDLQPAYVLHTRDYRDTSLLVDLLTLDHGVLRVVARGVRGQKRSQKRALLQPLQPLLISASGHGELLTLTQLEAAAMALPIAGSNLFSVMYINEILCRLLPAQESHPQLYRLYQSTLLALLRGAALEAVLRRFEFSLLAELGYAPELTLESNGATPLQPSQWYQFDPLHGFVPTQGAATDNEAAIRSSLFCGGDIQALADVLSGSLDDDFDQALLPTAKRLMRQALRPLLGARPLNSRRLFLSMHRARRSLPTPDSQ